MKFTKQERDLEALSLTEFGLLPEEVEGYFEFYEAIWSEDKPKKRIMIINSRKKAEQV